MSENKKSYLINILGSLSLAITVPWIIMKLFQSLYEKLVLSKFSGKVVVITGASSGLGEALAHEFFKRNCQVVLCSRRIEELERVKSELLQKYILNHTQPPIIHALDLSDINSLTEHVDQILSVVGHIDILINNSGISHRGLVVSTNPDVDIKVMLVNYFGTAALIKAVLPSMIKRKEGHIVAISSVQGLFALPQRSAYSASKHALQAFCDSLRAENAQHNIKVTVVSPGYIRTKLSLNALTGSGDIYGKLDKTTEQGYSPEYVAQLVLKAIVTNKNEVVISTFLPKLVIFLRKYFPSIYFYVMTKRAEAT